MHSDQLSKNIETLITSVADLQAHLDDVPLPLLERLSTETTHLMTAKQKSLAVAGSPSASTVADESHEYLQAMFESVKDYAIFTVDLQGQVTTWNPGAERIFGYSESEAIGQNASIIFTPEDRRQKVPEKEMRKALEKGFAEDERWHIRKDGSRFFASGMMRQLRDADGTVRGCIKVARDITEQKQAEAAEREQRQLAEALREISITLSSTFNLDELLEHILDTVSQVVPHTSATFLLIEQEVVGRIRSRGLVPEEISDFEAMIARYRLLVDEIPLFHTIIQSKNPLIINHIQVGQATHNINIPVPASTRSYLGMPIITNKRVLGLLNLVSVEPDFFTQDHVKILQAFAAQAALSINNAQLFLQAQELAALNERHKLARDLHDAVTQTLFSASAVAETLPRILDQNPDALRTNLELLSRMTRGALSEMRVLLSELRPTSIVNTPFSMLLRQLVEALQARKLISATYEMNDEPQLAPEVHIALYRIVQEALNNVSKHSQATQVIIHLQVDGGRIEVHIQDNGRGFQPEQISSGMGLGMMRERSEAIGAQLEIKNKDEGGTDIHVLWPAVASVAS
jgi:PAS domain S-box-containing protein